MREGGQGEREHNIIAVSALNLKQGNKRAREHPATNSDFSACHLFEH